MSYLGDILKDVNIEKLGVEACCKWLVNDMRSFLDLYNYHFIRFGSFIDDMYKLACVCDLEFSKCFNIDDFRQFYNKFKIFYTYKVNQYLLFKEIDDGKVRK